MFRTQSIIKNSDIFRHIHIPFIHFQLYCSIFKTLCNLDIQTCGIFTTLRYIQNSVKAYSGIFRCCIMLALWEYCHIQNFAMFRIWGYLGHKAYTVYLGIFMFILAYSIMIVIIALFFLYGIFESSVIIR